MKRIIIAIFLGIMLTVFAVTGYYVIKETNSHISKSQRIDTLIKDVIKKAKVPGASIVIINKEKTQYLNYGYGNKEKRILLNGKSNSHCKSKRRGWQDDNSH